MGRATEFIIAMGKITVLNKTLVLLLAALAIVLTRSIGGSHHTDLLAYTLRDGPGKTTLLMYDPRFGVSLPVHTDANASAIAFSFSLEGQLAFELGSDNVGQIHVWDTVSGQSSLIGFSPVPQSTFPTVWSPDGHYLAFVFDVDGKDEQLYVWDGKTTINVTPDGLSRTASIYSGIAWSADDRLAFTVFYPHGSTPLDDPDEIYLWDGKTTTNLSQNSIGHDTYPSWSPDGRLAFR